MSLKVNNFPKFIDTYLIDFKDENHIVDLYEYNSSITQTNVDQFKKLSKELKVIDGIIYPIQNFKNRVEIVTFIETLNGIE